MHIFLKNIKERGQSFGWHRILEIPKGVGTFIIIDQYGLVSLSEIQDHANIYEAANGHDTQNSSQMYNFIYASNTDEAKLMVILSDFCGLHTGDQRHPGHKWPMLPQGPHPQHHC